MLDTGKLLSEAESSQMAGVSTETIQRYKEFGLLEAIQREGQTFFRESDIRSLFYTKSKTAQAPSVPVSGDPISSTSAASTPPLSDSAPPSSSSAETIPESAPVEPLKPVTSEAQTLDSQEVPTLESILRETAPPQVKDSTESAAKATEFERKTDTQHAHPPHVGSFELLELTKTLKEQVEFLREERDWLRRRVEKLEAQTEREQMILLSESETIRNLIVENRERKRGFLSHFALPWIQLKAGKVD